VCEQQAKAGMPRCRRIRFNLAWIDVSFHYQGGWQTSSERSLAGQPSNADQRSDRPHEKKQQGDEIIQRKQQKQVFQDDSPLVLVGTYYCNCPNEREAIGEK
jgi:hypothetical protein